MKGIAIGFLVTLVVSLVLEAVWPTYDRALERLHRWLYWKSPVGPGKLSE